MSETALRPLGLLTTLGKAASAEARAAFAASPQWDGRRFVNPEGAHVSPSVGMAWDYLTAGSKHRKPAGEVPVVWQTAASLGPPSGGVRAVWLGHGTSLVEVEGRRVLVDPVWGEHAAPTALAGVRRFHPAPLSLPELPALDAVLLTHDHYDHLDAPTVAAIRDRVPRWVCPLGVGARLAGWGVAASRITELDWWGETRIGGDARIDGRGALRVVCTPARHFSGRGLRDRDTTLWSGWALVGAGHRALVGGDGGYSAAFAEIGRRLGPFDLALMEIGAYSPHWADIHMGPEQAVQAARDVGAELLLPVHWGTFDLALHGWTEPAERVVVAAKAAGLPLAVPRPGQPVDAAAPPPVERWWPELPWDDAETLPVVSAGVAERWPEARLGAGPESGPTARAA